MMSTVSSLNDSNALSRTWQLLHRRAVNLASDVRIPSRELGAFARRDRERPLVALVGLVKAGKSRFLELFAGERVGVVAAKEQSSHPVLLRFGNDPVYGLRFNDGSEAHVPREEFERRLSFDEEARRDELVHCGIVQLPIGLLEHIEFVDLPGLGGRRSAELDDSILGVAAQCPLAFVLASRLRRQVFEAAVPLARQGVSIVFVRTKADKELRGADPDEIAVQRLVESDRLAQQGVIAPILAVTSEAGAVDLGVMSIPRLREHVPDIIHYYGYSTICSRVTQHGVNAKFASKLHRRAAGFLAYCVGDVTQARHQAEAVDSPKGNILAEFLRSRGAMPRSTQ